MVKLNENLIRKYVQKRNSDQKEHNLCTHLILCNKNITTIVETSYGNKVSVLYLQENEIDDLQTFKYFPNLTHLYLQKNRIRKINGLNEMCSLKVLYLSQNYITVIEGLLKSTKLEELHVANQKKYPEDSLYFDPRTLSVLSKSLRRIDISGNQLLSIEPLECLSSLEELYAVENHIFDLTKTSKTISLMMSLVSLDLRKNYITEAYNYPMRIISSGQKIKLLDKKDVPESHRLFYTNILRNHELGVRKIRTQESTMLLFNTHISGISKQIPRSLRNSIIKSVKVDMKTKHARRKQMVRSLCNFIKDTHKTNSRDAINVLKDITRGSPVHNVN